MNLDVSLVLRLVDRITGPLNGVIEQSRRFETASKAAQAGASGQTIALASAAAPTGALATATRTLAASQNDSATAAARQAAALADQTRAARAGLATTQASIDANRSQQAALQSHAFGAGIQAYALRRLMQPALAFESAMADVYKVIDFQSEAGKHGIAQGIRNLSADSSMTQSGIASIVASAGQAGVVDAGLEDSEKSRQLLQFARDASAMGVAFDMAAQDAGRAMTGLRNIFHLNQNQVVSHADAVNHLSNNMDAYARDIVNVEARSGSMARLFGLNADQNAALAATFLQLKAPPEIAATGINALLNRLATADRQTQRFQGALSALDMDARELRAAIADDAQGALLEFLRTVETAPDVMGTLTDLFGAEYSDDIAKLVLGLGQYERALGLASNETAVAGSMYDEYANRAATRANALLRFENQMRNITIILGSTLLPALSSVLEAIQGPLKAFASWAEANPELSRAILVTAVSLLALKIAAIAVGFAWTGMVGAALTGVKVFHLATLGFAATRGAMIAATAPTTMLGRALMFLGGPVMKTVAAGLRIVAMATLANPVLLLITAVAAAAYVLYDTWDQIISYFGGAFSRISDAFGENGLLGALGQMFYEFNPIRLLLRAVDGLVDYLFDIDLSGAVRSMGAWFSRLRLSDYIPALNWDNLLTALNWATYLIPLRWLEFIPGFEWGHILTVLNWASYLIPLRWLEFLPGFEWSNFIPDINWGGWFDFEWADLLPSWDWSAIIPSLSGFFDSDAPGASNVPSVAAQASAAGLMAHGGDAGYLAGSLGLLDAAPPSSNGDPVVDYLRSLSNDHGSTNSEPVGNYLRNLDGARAGGGPVWPGGAFLVGENGPEIILPSQSGTVLPAPETRTLLDRALAAGGPVQPGGNFLLGEHADGLGSSGVQIDNRPPLQAPGRGQGSARGGGDIHINVVVNALPGMDERKLTEKILRELRDLKRKDGDLHDGATFFA